MKRLLRLAGFLFPRECRWLPLAWAALLTVLLLLSLFLWREYRTQVALIADQHIQSLDVAYRSTLAMNRLDIHTRFQLQVQRPDVLALVRMALEAEPEHLAVVRGRLYRLLQPLYVELQEQGLRQFQFHLRDDRVLLRFHAPQRANDPLFSVRPLLRLANTEQRVVTGWEVGRAWPGYRHIFPLYDGDEYLGSVELSMPFERIHVHLLDLIGGGDYLFMLHYDQLEHRIGVAYQTQFVVSPIADGFMVEHPTLSSVTRDFTQSQTARDLQGILRGQSRVAQKLEQNKSFVIPLFHGGRGYTAAFLAISGHVDDTVAYLVHFAPSSLLHKARQDLWRNIVLLALLFLVLGLSLWVVYRKQQALRADIVRRQMIEDDLRLYQRIFEHSGEAILITDRENRIIAINPALTQLTGYTLDDLRGHNPRILSSGHTPSEVHASLWAALQTQGWWQGELWDRRKDGSVYPKWVSISMIRNSAGGVCHYIASFTNITERKAKEEQIHHLAHHDPLTGLLNRHSLLDRLSQAVSTAQRQHLELAVFFIDMDRFKWINDSLGHLVGDQLLVEIARRLRALVRDSDIVARQGGDEFVVVLTQVRTSSTVSVLAERMRTALAEPYHLEGRILHSSPSIGVAIFPGDGTRPESLLQNADAAMYHAKDLGRNKVQFFTQAMNDAAVERVQLEHELRAAIQTQAFELHYQPQVYAATGQIYAVEALLRWNHPQRGPISPVKFIPLAEETGLIEPLGEWVLEEACRQAALWRGQGLDTLLVAINLSAQQLRSKTLALVVSSCLQRYQLPHDVIEFEITETVAMEDPKRAVDCLRDLRTLGVRLAIDDFGTGYSSLAYLKNLPIQHLKLDCSFVAGIESSGSDAAICAATVALAHELGLKVVAEGVETPAQQAFLVDHGCDYLQGYYFGRPAPAEYWTRHWLERGLQPLPFGEEQN